MKEPKDRKNLKWIYEINKKEFGNTSCNFYCKDRILIAKFDNSPRWFTPWLCLGIGVPTFIAYIRRLAKEYGAKEIIVSTLDKHPQDKLILFHYKSMFSSDILSADKDNWEHSFWEDSSEHPSIFSAKRLYGSQLFVQNNIEQHTPVTIA